MAKFTRAEIRRIIGESCTDEIENALVALHLGVVDPIKEELDKKTEELANAEKADSEFKAKFEKEHNDFEAFKKEIASKETIAAKEKAVKAFFEGKGITGANLDIALRGARQEIEAVELDGDKIKDSKALDALVKGTYKGLVVTTGAKGADVANPQTDVKGGSILSKADIYKRDEHGRYVLSTEERQKAILANLNAKGIN